MLHFAFSQPKRMSCSLRAKLKTVGKRNPFFPRRLINVSDDEFVNSPVLWNHMKRKGNDTQWGRQHVKKKGGYCKKDAGSLQYLRQRQ